MARRELPALWILLAVLGVMGAGLGVGHWRRAWPELAARAELLDRVPTVSSATSRAVSPATSRAAPPRALPDFPAPSRQPALGRQLGDLAGPATRTVPRSAPDRPAAAALDINRASVDELASLPGVTRKLAERVVAARAADGPFPSLDELARVRGFGARRLDRLRGALVASP